MKRSRSIMELWQNARVMVTRSEVRNLPEVTSCLISKLYRLYMRVFRIPGLSSGDITQSYIFFCVTSDKCSHKCCVRFNTYIKY